MDKKAEQEHVWNLLIELEVFPFLESEKNNFEKESFLVEYCKKNNIQIKFAISKIERIEKLKAQREKKIEEDSER